MNVDDLLTVSLMVLDVLYRYDTFRIGLIGIIDLSTFGFEHAIRVFNSQLLKFMTVGFVSSVLCFSFNTKCDYFQLNRIFSFKF